MERPSFIFTTPFNVNVVEEKGVERVFLEGLISTTDLDLVNDIVTKNCLESMQRQILGRNIKLDIEHESFRGKSVEEKELNKTKIPAGKITDATVVDLGGDRFGLRIKAELNRFNQRFDEIKGNVLERYLDAYSIAFIPTKTARIEKNGVMVRLLDDDRLLNVALTGNAVNTEALNQKVLMKAIDAVEEYKRQKLLDPELEGKLEVKSYEKDGAHAHTKEGPLGLHTHPEIEKMMAYDMQSINNRINFLSERLYDSLGDNSSESVMAIKTKLKDAKDKQSRTRARNAAIAEGDEDEEENPKKKKEDKNHNHLSDDRKINHNRRLKMTEDQPGKTPEGEETPETPIEPETPETPEVPETPETPEAPAEGAEAKAAEFKDLKGRLEATEKELAEIKALLSKPVHKSLAQTKDPAIGEEKAKEPLDVI